MNRREAIVASVAGIAAAVAGPSVADAEVSPGERPELQPIRALLHTLLALSVLAQGILGSV